VLSQIGWIDSEANGGGAQTIPIDQHPQQFDFGYPSVIDFRRKLSSIRLVGSDLRVRSGECGRMRGKQCTKPSRREAQRFRKSLTANAILGMAPQLVGRHRAAGLLVLSPDKDRPTAR
jgi:hypothetical protein